MRYGSAIIYQWHSNALTRLKRMPAIQSVLIIMTYFSPHPELYSTRSFLLRHVVVITDWIFLSLLFTIYRYIASLKNRVARGLHQPKRKSFKCGNTEPRPARLVLWFGLDWLNLHFSFQMFCTLFAASPSGSSGYKVTFRCMCIISLCGSAVIPSVSVMHFVTTIKHYWAHTKVLLI